MTRHRLIAVTCIALVAVSSGCVSKVDSSVSRGDVTFPVVSSVAGVAPNATTGAVALTGADGVRVTPDARNATVRLGLDGVVRTTGVLQACRDACDNHSAPAGMIISEGSLISFHNVSLNAIGPDGDAAVFFYDEGEQTGRFLRWLDARGVFQLSGPVEVGGSVRATGELVGKDRVGTVTVVPVDEKTIIEVHTSAMEGLEPVVFIRGTSRLVNGTATIDFPPVFRTLAGEGLVTAQVTLTSPGPAIYVKEKSRERLVVETTAGQRSDATFDLFVQAPRAGAEEFRAVRQVGEQEPSAP